MSTPELALVALLGAFTLGGASVFWHLLVRPEAVLRLFGPFDPEVDADDTALRVLRWTSGATLVGLAFVTAMVLAVLR